jgi:hypothetical protein
MASVFKNVMPSDEAIHGKRLQFYYEICAQHCQYRATEKCMGIDFCMIRENFK